MLGVYWVMGAPDVDSTAGQCRALLGVDFRTELNGELVENFEPEHGVITLCIGKAHSCCCVELETEVSGIGLVFSRLL